MASNTIKNFIVGIGYDYDQEGEKKIGSGIDSIKSKALQLGAVVAGAFGIKALTSDFAGAKDDLGKFAQVFGETANDVNSLGLALQREGGSLESFMNQIENLERLRAGLLRGDAGFIAQAGISGIDPNVITSAKSATQAYVALADQFENLTQQQRLNAAQALGLDEASIRLLSQGSDVVRQLADDQKRIRPITDEMTDAARDFNDEMQDLSNNIGGFSDRVSVVFLPQVNAVIAGMNDWVEVNRDFVNSGFDDFLKAIADNFGSIATVIGIISSASFFSTLSKLSKIPLIGGALSATGAAGTALAGVGAAGFAGFKVGEFLQENLIKGTAAEGAIQDLVDNILGTEAITFTPSRTVPMITAPDPTDIPILPNAFAPDLGDNGHSLPPITVQVKLDSKVFDNAVVDVLGGEAQQAVESTTSSIGG